MAIASRSAIQWTETVMWINETHGGLGGTPRVRKRVYRRKRTNSPGRAERRLMRESGKAWCKDCYAWIDIREFSVVKRGLCRVHANAAYRLAYANGGNVATRARVYARKRSIAPVNEHCTGICELFDGRCAYCPAMATTWDHVVPVARGGQLKRGNIVPACVSCNSSKNTSDVVEWIRRTGRSPHPELLEVLAHAEAA